MEEVQALENDHLHHERDFLKLRSLLLQCYQAEAEARVEAGLLKFQEEYDDLTHYLTEVKGHLVSGFPSRDAYPRPHAGPDLSV